jgi:hypothetical protein
VTGFAQLTVGNLVATGVKQSQGKYLRRHAPTVDDRRPGVESQHALAARLAESISELQNGAEPDVDLTLAELTAAAAQSVPGAQHAGITVVRRRNKVETASSTHRVAKLLDDIQGLHAEGPCVSAAWDQQIIRIDDMAAESRWPRYCQDAMDRTPIRSVLSFRLFVEHNTMSALNFYAHASHAFGDEAVEVGLLWATHTALAWNVVRRDQQFRSALISRDIIGQAKGMLMERFDVDAVRAFDIMKRLSQDSNKPLVLIAERLVHTRECP